MSIKAPQLIDGDIVIENGRILWVTGAKAVRQRLENRLALWQGDWFLDTDAGIPWKDILEGGFGDEQIKQVIKGELLADEYVSEVISIDLARDRANRALNVTFQSKGLEGMTEGEVSIINAGVL